ncbi:GTP 3',8-cyclase MoaA [Gilvimarinus chinensis]|uniref:GTP 3',8-cyclase MoaA n=1 Tax=Gilvimarinus chinensis TaxID=396005 RepID=UPI0003A67D73|nr:GTP 3',8-cyclase MoaA [Gilvimarinus chinensis]
MSSTNMLVDKFGRTVNYLRMSVTDRCDLRCVYCMAEEMTFLPRNQVLSLEELERLAAAFTRLGVRKLRLTGGEPLVRQGLVGLVAKLRQLPDLEELCLTTNGTRLEDCAAELKKAGLDRLNVSLDTLNADKFRELTRFGDVRKVLKGIVAAQKAGFKRIKINCVALKNRNADEVVSLVRYALDQGLDISFIEEMPLGKIDSHGRAAEFIASAELRKIISAYFPLVPSSSSSGGPARYWMSPGFDSRIGFISPHSNNFCASCNRVRLTATGRLLLCLGQEYSTDLRAVLREFPNDEARLEEVIVASMALKPKEHSFDITTDEPQIVRFMNTTGG